VRIASMTFSSRAMASKLFMGVLSSQASARFKVRSSKLKG
jgi:hypothetical protein